MTLKGHICNGVIVLDEPISLPEGVAVEIHLEAFEELELPVVSPLMKYAGQAQGLGRDASRSIDQVLYGTREVL